MGPGHHRDRLHVEFASGGRVISKVERELGDALMGYVVGWRWGWGAWCCLAPGPAHALGYCCTGVGGRRLGAC